MKTSEATSILSEVCLTLIDPHTMGKFQALQNDNLTYHGTDEVVKLLHQADVMVSDNSSILQEFLLLGKPVVTFRNHDPQSCMIDIQEPAELETASATQLLQALVLPSRVY